MIYILLIYFFHKSTTTPSVIKNLSFAKAHFSTLEIQRELLLLLHIFAAVFHALGGVWEFKSITKSVDDGTSWFSV